MDGRLPEIRGDDRWTGQSGQSKVDKEAWNHQAELSIPFLPLEKLQVLADKK